MSGDKKKIALLFPGQGAQYVGMAKDLFDEHACVRSLFEQASDITGIDCKKLMFESDDETLRQTENTQISVTLANLSALCSLEDEGLDNHEITAVAGFSLGEYSALVASGVINSQTCFHLVRERGRMMREQGERIISSLGQVSMAAVIGLSPESVESVINLAGRQDVFCANYNSPTQVVISGLAAGIEALKPQLTSAGARRILPLKVSGPFHTSLLNEAEQEFSQFLSGINFHAPTCALFSNVTGAAVSSAEEAKQLLARQICQPVRWINIENEIKNLLEDNFIVIESGPGTTLCGLWKAMGFNQAYPAGKHEEIIQACSLL